MSFLRTENDGLLTDKNSLEVNVAQCVNVVALLSKVSCIIVAPTLSGLANKITRSCSNWSCGLGSYLVMFQIDVLAALPTELVTHEIIFYRLHSYVNLLCKRNQHF